MHVGKDSEKILKTQVFIIKMKYFRKPIFFHVAFKKRAELV